jgi:hypothetical protein
VDRVGGLDPLLVGGFGGAGGELAAMPGVELGECARDDVDVRARRSIGFLK